MSLGIEGVAGCRRDLGQPVGLGDPVQLAQGQFQAGPQWIGFGGRGQASLHAVEQRQQVREQALVGEAARGFQLAGHALALVVEVGAFAQ